MVTAMDGSSSMIGSIDLKCEISPIISQAYMAARDICEYHYMTAPELDYRYIISSLKYVIFQHFAKKNGKTIEFLTGGVELLWGKCTVFPDLGTGDTDRWRINLHLCATCQYPLNRNWKNCAIAPK